MSFNSFYKLHVKKQNNLFLSACEKGEGGEKTSTPDVSHTVQRNGDMLLEHSEYEAGRCGSLGFLSSTN